MKIYNHLTHKKETFRPIKKGRVGLYTCGPTVYNYAHIGNLRTYIFEDVLRRTLEHFGYDVRHVMNITDVDDKTIRDSKKAGKTLRTFTQFYEKKFFADVKKLNILPAWKYPAATKHVKEMVRLINILLKKRLAYRTEDGIYFDISKFRAYGKLSRVKQKNLKAGVRIAADEYSKENVEDFALWKKKKPGEPSWPAYFNTERPARPQSGRREVRPGIFMPGRPGWHIECSAMSMKYLGRTFDIHAGAVDLIFPHHEDEIAQSEGATGKPFVKYFVEGEHLLVDGKKMSKSLGNVYTLGDLERKGFEPLDFRYFVLGAHYRTQLNFTWEAVEAARATRLRILDLLDKIRSGPFKGTPEGEKFIVGKIEKYKNEFYGAVADDLNTPIAIARLFWLVRLHKFIDSPGLTKRSAKMILSTAYDFDRVLGLGFKKAKKLAVPESIRVLVEKREALRKEKKWKEADHIREKIKKLGYLIEDAPRGPAIKKKTGA